jgi:hypothetical protein
MNVRKLARSGYLLTAIALTPMASMGTSMRTSAPEQAARGSHTRDVSREASLTLAGIRADALQAEDHAGQLLAFARNTSVDWQTHGGELEQIREEVNDIGAKLSRLEGMRSAVLPWQREAIERTEVAVREMADNTRQAIGYLKANQGRLWNPVYEHCAANLYNESSSLSRTIGDFEKMARLRREERDLETELGTNAGD